MDKQKLISEVRLDEDDVDIPDVGTVRVRALSRAEVFVLQGKGGKDPAGSDALMLAMAMVEPALTVDEVKAWQRVAKAGEIEPVSDRILALSGLAEEAAKAQKAAYQSFRDEPGE